MKPSRTCKIILMISGSLSILFGALVLFFPVNFYAFNGIDISDNVDLLNEIRAPAGALFVAGFVIMKGAFKAEMTYTSLVVSSLLYLSYAGGRLVSITTDGVPSDTFIYVTFFEVVVGALCLIKLINQTK